MSNNNKANSKELQIPQVFRTYCDLLITFTDRLADGKKHTEPILEVLADLKC